MKIMNMSKGFKMMSMLLVMTGVMVLGLSYGVTAEPNTLFNQTYSNVELGLGINQITGAPQLVTGAGNGDAAMLGINCAEVSIGESRQEEAGPTRITFSLSNIQFKGFEVR